METLASCPLPLARLEPFKMHLPFVSVITQSIKWPHELCMRFSYNLDVLKVVEHSTLWNNSNAFERYSEIVE